MLEVFLRHDPFPASGVDEVLKRNSSGDASVDGVLPFNCDWASFRIVVHKVNGGCPSLFEDLYADLLSLPKKDVVEISTSLCMPVFQIGISVAKYSTYDIPGRIVGISPNEIGIYIS